MIKKKGPIKTRTEWDELKDYCNNSGKNDND